MLGYTPPSPDQRQTLPPPPGPEADPPAQCILGNTVNKRAVRILLECILVYGDVFKLSVSCNQHLSFDLGGKISAAIIHLKLFNLFHEYLEPKKTKMATLSVVPSI